MLSNYSLSNNLQITDFNLTCVLSLIKINVQQYIIINDNM